jgi:hypothetical protein
LRGSSAQRSRSEAARPALTSVAAALRNFTYCDDFLRATRPGNGRLTAVPILPGFKALVDDWMVANLWPDDLDEYLTSARAAQQFG